MFDCRLVKRRRDRKKGPSLVEASPCDPKSNNQMQKEQLKMISMLIDMESKESLKRHAVMVIAKKLAWHVQSYATIKLKIFFFCYVLLWF